MTPEQIQTWLALFATAQAISQAVIDGVRQLAQRELSPDELAAVLAQWDDNVARSARNAGLDG